MPLRRARAASTSLTPGGNCSSAPSAFLVQPFHVAQMAQAGAAQGRPVMLDFYAD
ncbi:hypothetical protein [Pseudoduganella sp. HUAS MS19]